MNKILHITTTLKGGAGKVPELYAAELDRLGHESKILVKCDADDKLVSYFKSKYLSFSIYCIKILTLIIQKCNGIFGSSVLIDKYCFYNTSERYLSLSAKKILKKVEFTPDIIMIYWVANFINAKTIHDLYRLTNAKIVMVLTDMGPLTGGCHFAWDCKGYTSNCQNCPVLEDSVFFTKHAQKNLASRKKYLEGIPIEIISVKGEVLDQVNKSKLFGDSLVHDRNIPVELNFDNCKLNVREKYHISDDKKVFFCAAANVKDARKGFDVLIKALNLVHESISDKERENIVFLFAGHLADSILSSIPFTTYNLGFVDYTDELPAIFNCADAYISPSIQDSGPYLVNLSIGAGCPVISFNIGVAKDLVRDGISGYKANNVTAIGLSECILKFNSMDQKGRAGMRDKCKEIAGSELNWDNFFNGILN